MRKTKRIILTCSILAALLAGTPMGQDPPSTAAVPDGFSPDEPFYAAGPSPAGPVGGVIRVYKDSNAWFGENRDHNTLLALGKVLGSDYFIHPVADLANPIPAGTAVVLLSSNGFGLPGPVAAQNSPAAQANLDAFVRAGGILIIDMGDNVFGGGYIAPGSTGTPDLIFPGPCADATLAPAALGTDGILGTADDHPIVLGPDGLAGTADDLNNSNIDLASSCFVAHGNLQSGISLPMNSTSLMTATFAGLPEPILAEYCLDSGLVILDTITKEFVTHQGPSGTGTGPTFFMINLFDYALGGQAAQQCFLRVDIDIKFCSNPNAFNCKSHGVLPLTIFGSADVDVADIVIGSLRLCRADDLSQCTGAPRSWSFADRGNPSSDLGAGRCAVVDGVEQDFLNPDGFLDLDAAFDSQEVAQLIGCAGLAKKDASVALVLTGELTSGRPIGSTAVNNIGIDQLFIQNN